MIDEQNLSGVDVDEDVEATPVADALEASAAVHDAVDQAAAETLVEAAERRAAELDAAGEDEAADEVLADAMVEVAVDRGGRGRAGCGEVSDAIDERGPRGGDPR